MIAMMMTGRVLLVCALCVLWCDVAAASAADGKGDTITKEDEKTRTTEVSPPGRKKESPVTSGQESAGNVRTPQSYGVDIPLPNNLNLDQKQEGEIMTENEDDDEDEEENEEDAEMSENEEEGDEDTETREKQPPPGPPPPPPSGQTSTPTINGNSAGTSNEARTKELPSSDKDSTQGQVLKSSAPAATPQVKNEDPGSADVVSVQQVQKAQSGLESGSESRKEDGVLTTNKQQDGTSDSHAESTPTSRSSAKSVAASNGPDKATEEEISNKNTARVDEVPEAAQEDGNKDDNTKETPIKTTAIANGTAPTGDSDGSTAVSHTTSPLLLLLFVVACAAAAAVVAA
ncbi:Mucin-associated surface protein (MASP) subgroup S071 [Trypanosoma cruzi]|uniref:Mucin-associated surface protein (MASP) subgroup S071 n=2 Tax=Trypanosoma cruzi TaxID=5693 RepID=A0A7J6YE21_TRYCR|nr:Mucin-associated surface protein (MASP) subgroup S071 [Trypanosoma cruzi]